MTTVSSATAPPVPGRTFSLFGTGDSADGYYRQIARAADACLERSPDIGSLIAEVRSLAKRPRLAKKLGRSAGTSLSHILVHTSRSLLSPYTTAVERHLRELSVFKRFDGVLAFTEEQYHLAMLEIELMNRANADRFRNAPRKLAFLPHCLRDLEANCRSAPADIDYACRGCSQRCHVHQVTALLRQNGIEPYLWMQADLKKLLRNLRDTEGGLGVLGIACVPELVKGMRRCVKLDIPVVGVPLNANRCARWMGDFHPTSVTLREVERLIRPEEQAVSPRTGLPGAAVEASTASTA
jgi:hypothetical protein